MAAAGYQSKILDAAARRRGLGSFGDLGPGALAVGEWQALGLELPDLAALRAYRLARVRAELAARDCAGIVVTDPINIRYTTDAANMQVWCLHNAARYAFVATEGPIVLFDFHGCAHLAEPLALVDEVRPARAWYYFHSGPRLAEHAGLWAAELADLVRAHGGGNRRLAIDKADRAGVVALETLGVDLQDGQEIMEQARAIKSPDEIKAMRCALAACEAAMGTMQAELRAGMTEQELWALLHAENIKRGGEWIETRLLSSGPRTNPWFQECSSRVIESGDLIAFDTDLIGPYGYCVDISRTWRCGQGGGATLRSTSTASPASRLPVTSSWSARGSASASSPRRRGSCPSAIVPIATRPSPTASGSATSTRRSTIRRTPKRAAMTACSRRA